VSASSWSLFCPSSCRALSIVRLVRIRGACTTPSSPALLTVLPPDGQHLSLSFSATTTTPNPHSVPPPLPLSSLDPSRPNKTTGHPTSTSLPACVFLLLLRPHTPPSADPSPLPTSHPSARPSSSSATSNLAACPLLLLAPSSLNPLLLCTQATSRPPEAPIVNESTAPTLSAPWASVNAETPTDRPRLSFLYLLLLSPSTPTFALQPLPLPALGPLLLQARFSPGRRRRRSSATWRRSRWSVVCSSEERELRGRTPSLSSTTVSQWPCTRTRTCRTPSG
jgi:hypothetical protein